jgi:hypothetical protein
LKVQVVCGTAQNVEEELELHELVVSSDTFLLQKVEQETEFV